MDDKYRNFISVVLAVIVSLAILFLFNYVGSSVSHAWTIKTKKVELKPFIMHEYARLVIINEQGNVLDLRIIDRFGEEHIYKYELK